MVPRNSEIYASRRRKKWPKYFRNTSRGTDGSGSGEAERGSSLCHPGSESRLGGKERKRKAQMIKWGKKIEPKVAGYFGFDKTNGG